MFFVLSSFLTTWLLYDRIQSCISVGHFTNANVQLFLYFVKRMLRIAPPFIVLVLLLRFVPWIRPAYQIPINDTINVGQTLLFDPSYDVY